MPKPSSQSLKSERGRQTTNEQRRATADHTACSQRPALRFGPLQPIADSAAARDWSWFTFPNVGALARMIFKLLTKKTLRIACVSILCIWLVLVALGFVGSLGGMRHAKVTDGVWVGMGHSLWGLALGTSPRWIDLPTGDSFTFYKVWNFTLPATRLIGGDKIIYVCHWIWTLVVLVITTSGIMLSREKRTAGLCSECGYSRAGLDSELTGKAARCPECGAHLPISQA